MRYFLDIARVAVLELWSKKTRSVLSMLGIVIGILTVSSLLTLALSVRNSVTSSVQDIGANTIFVLSGGSRGGGTPNFSSQLGASTLTETDFEAIKKKAPEAMNVSMGMPIAGTVRVGETVLQDSLIFATSPGADKVLNIEMAKGRFLNDMDNQNKARVAAIGAFAKQSLFGDSDAIDREIEIRGEKYKIIGVFKEKPATASFGGPDINDLIEIPIETGWQVTKIRQVFRIMMQAPDAQSVIVLKEKVKSILLSEHKGEEDFSVYTQDDLLGVIGGILDILTAMLSSIALISLLVGGIGIMNIMLVSVSERQKEIGIRKAIGATDGAILLQFLVESILITFFAGVLASIIYSAIITVVSKSGKVPFPITVDYSIILLSLGFSAVVGVVFGVIPALQASRKDPVAALRSE